MESLIGVLKIWLCEVWSVSWNSLKMDIGTWCPISEAWDVNIDRFYFPAVTYTGWFREFGWMEGVWGRRSQALLRLYAIWQVQFQECVDDSYDVWSTFHYIPYFHQYIQHNKIQSVKLNALLSVVFVLCLETSFTIRMNTPTCIY